MENIVPPVVDVVVPSVFDDAGDRKRKRKADSKEVELEMKPHGFLVEDRVFKEEARFEKLEIDWDTLDSDSDSDDSQNPNKKRKKVASTKTVNAACEGSSNGSTGVGVKTLHIVSAVLASCSPFFYNLFKNGMKESQERNVTLIIHPSEERAFMDLLNFMYTDKLSASSAPDLLGVLMLADKYEVSSCMSHCSKLLEEMPMSLESALLYLEIPSSLIVGEVVLSRIDEAKNYLQSRYKYMFNHNNSRTKPSFSSSLPLSEKMGKGTKRNSAGEDSVDRGNKYMWSNEDVKILLGVLVDILKKNGYNATFQWPVVVARFHELSKSRVNNVIVKNKYNYMKRQWMPWNILRFHVTGAGWDEEKHMVTAPEEWWERNKSEDYYTFKNKPISKDISDMMDDLYMDTVATGRYQLAPSGNPTPDVTLNNTPSEIVEIDESSGGNELDNDMATLMNVNLEDDADTEIPLRDSPATQPQGKATKAYTTSFASGSLKKMRLTPGTKVFLQSCEMMSQASDCIVSTMSSKAKNKECEHTVEEAVSVLNRLVEDLRVDYGTAIWCYALSELAKPRRREIFMLIPDDHGRAVWLNHEYNLMIAHLPK